MLSSLFFLSLSSSSPSFALSLVVLASVVVCAAQSLVSVTPEA